MILRRALRKDYLNMTKLNDYYKFFAEIDSFVAQSRGNDTIICVNLSPYDDDDVDPGDYEIWDKVGQGVGNLGSLDELRYAFVSTAKRTYPTGRYWLASCRIYKIK
jgi:hypothetical protein